MFKKPILTSLLLFSCIIIYPTTKEKSNLFDYCYSLEKILPMNSIQKRRDISETVKSISKLFLNKGINKTRGSLINQIIDQFKTSNNSFLVNLIPNKIYCFAGYWIEIVSPGTIESIIYENSKRRYDEIKNSKDEVEGLLNDIHLEYKSIKKEFNLKF